MKEEVEDLEIYKKKIIPGKEIEILIKIGELPSRTPVHIPIFINKSQKPGPTLLLLGGLHGDEINGVEIIRRIKEDNLHIPNNGTIITIPVLNIFGFNNFSREVPDGKDVNRSFPGTKSGSLASRMAYNLMKEILPHVDFGIDFHTGGASRTNYPQIRCDMKDPMNRQMALAFNAPFTLQSSTIKKSLRSESSKMGKNIIVFEGGESLRYDEFVIKTAVDGYRRFIGKMGLVEEFEIVDEEPSIIIDKTRWVRASGAGLFRPYVYSGKQIEKGELLGEINGPYGHFKIKIVSPIDGFVIGLNNNPVVNPGDALLHLGVV